MKILKRYKLATLLNVLGLAVALAAFYLFMTQVIYNYTYNSSIPHHERVYRVEYNRPKTNAKWAHAISRPLVEKIKEITHVEKVMAVYSWIPECKLRVGENEFDAVMLNTTDSIADFFGARMLYGSEEGYTTTNMIITRSEALRIFGKENAVGESFRISMWRNTQCTIVGVIDDLPDNMFVKPKLFYSMGKNNLNNHSEWSYITYVRLDSSANKADVEASLLETLSQMYGLNLEDFLEKADYNYRLTPVDETWFSGVSVEDKGNKNVMNVLLGAGIFLLFVAFLNLSNFSLSLSPVRIKGVNTRKVLGAKNAALRFSIIKENVILSLMAIGIAAMIVLLFARSTWCSSLLLGSVAFEEHLPLVAATAVAGLVIGICSAIYPAWYATSFAPAMVLKGSFALSPQGRLLRMVMLLMQFAISVALVIYVMVLMSQSHYIFNADYGYDKDVILTADLQGEAYSKKTAVRQELMQLPCVECVGYSRYVVGDGEQKMGWHRGDGDYRMSFTCIPADYELLRAYGIDIIEGRDFNEHDMKTGAYIVNKAMADSYEWLKLDNKIFHEEAQVWQSNYPVVGICRNIKVQTMREDNNSINMAFIIFGPDMQNWGDQLGIAIIRTKAGFDKLEARRQITEVMKKFDANKEWNIPFLDNHLEQAYQEEFRFISQVEVFAFICILITLFGVFCLTMFETEFRRKEIAIRKVLGSTEGEVLSLFTGRYIAPLIIAFCVGAPVAYLLSKKWLEGFVEHTPIYWWLFPLALCLVSTIVLLTVVVQSWRVARSNPIEGVRTE